MAQKFEVIQLGSGLYTLDQLNMAFGTLADLKACIENMLVAVNAAAKVGTK